MVSNIVVVDALTYALLHSVYDSKAVLINVQHCLIWELMLYKFKLGPNTVKTTKNICCVKDEYAIDYSTVTKWLNKFCLDCMIRQGQVGLKTMDSKVVLQVMEVNLASNPWRVSGGVGFSQSSVVHYLHYLGKKASGVAELLSKYCKTFDSP